MQSGFDSKAASGAGPAASSAGQQNANHVHRGAPANVLPAYLAFALKSTLCPDLELHAFGRCYPAHRILLAQSSFFRAMLTGGWAEHSQLRPTLHSSPSNRGAQLRLSFDDPHIGRAAFEYCLTALYGAEPRLVLPSWARPTPTHPLSLAWPPRAVRMPPSELELEVDGIAQCDLQELAPLPENAHPATPRFLLSLLSTSLYLGIPSISSRALTLILASITPWTLPTYLRYAIGEGVDCDPNIAEGDLDQEIDGPLASAEELGTPLDETDLAGMDQQCFEESGEVDGVADQMASTSLSSQAGRHGSHLEGSEARKEAETSSGQVLDARADSPLQAIKKHSHDASPVMHSKRSSSSAFQSIRSASPPTLREPRARRATAARVAPSRAAKPRYDYGPAAVRIGEACACWISRWGADVIQVEEAMAMLEEQLEWRVQATTSEGGVLHADDDRDTSMDDAASSSSVGSMHGARFNAAAREQHETPAEYTHAFPPPPKLAFWGPSSQGGIPASWVRGTISADTLCVRGEAERWDLARRVVDLRRGALIANAQRDGNAFDDPDRYAPSHQEDEVSTEDDTYESDGSSALPQSDPHWARETSSHRRRTATRRTAAPRHSAADSDPEAPAHDLSGWCDTAELEADEAEYIKLFCEGIYYTHMAFAELSKIHQCISPHTCKPYTPQGVLQAAHWAGHELQNRILAAAPTADDPHAGTSSPDDDDRDVAGGDGEGNTAQRQAGAGDVTPSAAAAAASSSLANAATKKEPSTSSLGVSSHLADFERAASKAEGQSRTSRNKLGTPSRTRFGTPVRNVSTSTPPPPDHAHLGGLGNATSLGASMLLGVGGGAGGGGAALLRRSFFPVPADDTVRLGDGLGALTSAPNAAAAAATAAAVAAALGTGPGLDSDSAGIYPSAASGFNAASWDGPLGLAAAREPSTLPMPSTSTSKTMTTTTPTNVVGGGHMSGRAASSTASGSDGHAGGLMMSSNGNMTATRDAAGFFGTANIVQTGSELASHSTRIRNSAKISPATLVGGMRANASDEEYRAEGGAPVNEAIAPSPRADAALKSRWTAYEPMRLGVEFYGVDKLAEKQRLYSPTFFYAGSIWNLYCQTLRKPKGLQLGVYLHRQSPSEPLPPASEPPVSYNAYEFGHDETSASAHLTPEALRLIRQGGPNLVESFTNAQEALWQTGPQPTASSSSSTEVEEAPSIRLSLPSGTQTLQLGLGGAPGGTSVRSASSSPQPRTSSRREDASANTASDATSSSNNAPSFLEPAVDSSLGTAAREATDLPPIPLFPRSSAAPPLYALASGALGTNAYPSSTGSASLFACDKPSVATSVSRNGKVASTLKTSSTTTTNNVFASEHGSSTSGALQAQNPASFLPAPSSPTTPSVPSASGLATLARPSPASASANVNASSCNGGGGGGGGGGSSNGGLGSNHTLSMPYRDDRRLLRAFFAIHCPSPLGSALTRFSSGPDQFTVSQSWGWKSSSLLGATFLVQGELGSAKTESAKRFRCVCTIGLI